MEVQVKGILRIADVSRNRYGSALADELVGRYFAKPPTRMSFPGGLSPATYARLR